MTDHDVLAHERFRTALTEPIQIAADEDEVTAVTTHDLREELKRRMLSVLDGTHYTEDEEMAEALADAALRGIKSGTVATWPATTPTGTPGVAVSVHRPTSAHDPIAHERFRTICDDTIEREDSGDDYPTTSDMLAAVLTQRFPTAHFERTVNEHGVAVRRVHVVGEWEVDPEPCRDRVTGLHRSPCTCSNGEPQRCPNCAPGYDCESGMYVR